MTLICCHRQKSGKSIFRVRVRAVYCDQNSSQKYQYKSVAVRRVTIPLYYKPGSECVYIFLILAFLDSSESTATLTCKSAHLQHCMLIHVNSAVKSSLKKLLSAVLMRSCFSSPGYSEHAPFIYFCSNLWTLYARWAPLASMSCKDAAHSGWVA